MNKIRICFDRLPPTKRYRGVEDPRAAAERSKVWHQRSSLSVRFLGGTPRLRARVAEAACEWNQYSGIGFVFDDAEDAPIRVGFVPGDGSWSYVGSDAVGIPRSHPTINFGWFDDDTPDDDLRRTVLHEFGHALGLIHEHQSPAADIPWDKAAVYRIYAGPPNYWTKRLVDANVFDRYSRSQTNYSAFDPESIMLYPIEAELTGGRLVVGWNDTLSAMDKAFIAQLYPVPVKR